MADLFNGSDFRYIVGRGHGADFVCGTVGSSDNLVERSLPV